MPAWKREILERRRAKGASTAEGSPGGGGGGSGSSGSRQNGSAVAVNGSKQDNGGGGSNNGGNGRNYTITSASQHFGSNKETRHTERATPKEDRGEESLVLQESLGPLEENPFIKLEKERRRRLDRDSTARPVQHILELYGSVPGIRTIRAENIIIIESDPEFFPDVAGGSGGGKWQQNGVGAYSSLNDLLDRRGSAVTEIRAKEVVIYDTTISKSEENLSTLGRPDAELQAFEGSGLGQGRVSQMLQKFDSNYGKLQKKSHSTENLLDLDCSGSSGRPRLWAPKPDAVPKPRLEPASPGAFRPKPEPESPQRTPTHSVFSFRQRFQDGGSSPKDEVDSRPPKPTREREWDTSADPKPKVPCSPETRRARASESSPSHALRSTADFEIRPSPKPDMTRIPDNDMQARALANLRLQSKNSFMVIPKRRPAVPAGPVKSSPSHRAVPTSPTATTNDFSKTTPLKSTTGEISKTPVKVPPLETPTSVPKSPPPSPTKPVAKPVIIPPSFPDVPDSKQSEVKRPESPSSVPTSPPPLASPPPSPPAADRLPITNIDDIEVEPSQRVPAPSPLVHRRKGNTFTVVPKRRAETDSPQQQQPTSPDLQPDVGADASPGSTPPQAPYSQLGTLLKKRYPGVEEIEVIGGYLSLAKSCLVKTGSSGKKLKISFNEASLQSTYEYPSETSAWDSEDEEDDSRKDSPEEQPSMVGRIHIPRAALGGSPTHANNANNANDLSNYIPKHSVDYNTWQEQRSQEQKDQESTKTESPAHVTEEVMLTPADSSSLSDFSSEPALYF